VRRPSARRCAACLGNRPRCWKTITRRAIGPLHLRYSACGQDQATWLYVCGSCPTLAGTRIECRGHQTRLGCAASTLLKSSSARSRRPTLPARPMYQKRSESKALLGLPHIVRLDERIRKPFPSGACRRASSGVEARIIGVQQADLGHSSTHRPCRGSSSPGHPAFLGGRSLQDLLSQHCPGARQPFARSESAPPRCDHSERCWPPNTWRLKSVYSSARDTPNASSGLHATRWASFPHPES